MANPRGIFIRGQKNPGGTSQWIKVGELRDENGKQYILLETMALSPSILWQLDTPVRQIIANLYDLPDQELKQRVNKKDSTPPQKARNYYGDNDLDDDIPF